MQIHPLETFARELRACLASGALAHRGRIELSDGVSVDFERMARIVLTDFERVALRVGSDWFTEDVERALYGDLLRLHALTLAPA
jgi:hypothetical protein